MLDAGYVSSSLVCWRGGDGKIVPRCVPGHSSMAKCPRNAFPRRPTVTRFSRDAFPGALPWQDFAAMRSRAAIRGNFFSLHVSQKGPRTGKSPLPGKIRTPCIRNELALARYACHVSEKPRKPPSEDTPREDLARKGHLSLHGPLESCTARESCHPPPNSASNCNHGAALMGGGTGRGRLLVGRGDAAKGVRGVVGCRALAAKLASVKLRLQVSDADNLAES